MTAVSNSTGWDRPICHRRVYGQRLGQLLHLKDTPPSLITRSLRSVELAVTETRDDNPVPGLSGSFPPEDAYHRQPEISRLQGLRILGARQVRDQDGYPGRRNISVRPEARSALCDRQAVPLPVSSICRARRSTTSPNRPAHRASANSPVELGIGHRRRGRPSYRRVASGGIASAGREPTSFSSIT